MNTNWKRLLRKVHYWCSLAIAVPSLVIITSGLVLQLKKHVEWIQPPMRQGDGGAPSVRFDDIMNAAASVTHAGIQSWDDVERLDVRPAKGVVKVRGKNRWEVQVDTATGEVLQVRYRRSDLIESIHDGSFFHSAAKLWLFLPAGVILLVMWLTGMYLFLLPFLARRGKSQRSRQAVGR